MTTPETTDLPPVVLAHLTRPALDQFTVDAAVTDEGHTHRGHEQIGAWLTHSPSEWTFTTERIGSARVDDEHWTVTNHLEGDFPGGVVDLVYRYTLRDGLIAELTIAP